MCKITTLADVYNKLVLEARSCKLALMEVRQMDTLFNGKWSYYDTRAEVLTDLTVDKTMSFVASSTTFTWYKA